MITTAPGDGEPAHEVPAIVAAVHDMPKGPAELTLAAFCPTRGVFFKRVRAKDWHWPARTDAPIAMPGLDELDDPNAEQPVDGSIDMPPKGAA